MYALESSKSGSGALMVIPNVSHVPETSSPIRVTWMLKSNSIFRSHMGQLIRKLASLG